jgi:membrane fusion protein (multidrug efflux system)
MSSGWWLLLSWLAPALAEPLVLPVALEAAESAQVFALQSGVVRRVWRTVGETVAAGDTLACLEEGDLRLEEDAAFLVLQQAEKRLARIRPLFEQGGIAAQDLETLEFAVQTAQLRYRKAELERERAVLRAPIGGVVAAADVEVGERIATGKVCFRILDTTDLQAELFVPVDRLAEVKLGQKVTAQGPAMPTRRLEGSVVRLSPLVDPESGRGAVRVRFPGAGKAVKPGTVVDVTLTKEEGVP